MFRVLDKIAHEVMLGPHERKVKNYLDEATTGQSVENWIYKLLIYFLDMS